MNPIKTAIKRIFKFVTPELSPQYKQAQVNVRVIKKQALLKSRSDLGNWQVLTEISLYQPLSLDPGAACLAQTYCLWMVIA